VRHVWQFDRGFAYRSPAGGSQSANGRPPLQPPFQLGLSKLPALLPIMLQLFGWFAWQSRAWNITVPMIKQLCSTSVSQPVWACSQSRLLFLTCSVCGFCCFFALQEIRYAKRPAWLNGCVGSWRNQCRYSPEIFVL